MIDWLRSLRSAARERANRRLVTACGEGTQLVGVVDRRAPGASIVIGRGCLIEGQLVVERDASRIELGNNVLVGGGTVLDCALSIVIEDDVLVSYQCVLADSDNHSIYPELRRGDLASWMDGRRHDWSSAQMAPIRIGRGAWVGARTIVAGNPARVVREVGAAPVR